MSILLMTKLFAMSQSRIYDTVHWLLLTCCEFYCSVMRLI